MAQVPLTLLSLDSSLPDGSGLGGEAGGGEGGGGEEGEAQLATLPRLHLLLRLLHLPRLLQVLHHRLQPLLLLGRGSVQAQCHGRGFKLNQNHSITGLLSCADLLQLLLELLDDLYLDLGLRRALVVEDVAPGEVPVELL